MTAPTSGDLKEIAAMLALRRIALLASLKKQLQGADNAGTLALVNHYEETGDWVQADLENDTEIAMVSRRITALRDIDAALKRLRNGWDGACANCGEPIPVERLRVNPSTHTCVTCQAQAEERRGGIVGASL
jgi:DnaK suppressor protein